MIKPVNENVAAVCRSSLRQTGPGPRGAVQPEREVPVPGVRKGRRRGERDREVAVPGSREEVAQHPQQTGQVSSVPRDDYDDTYLLAIGSMHLALSPLVTGLYKTEPSGLTTLLSRVSRDTDSFP